MLDVQKFNTTIRTEKKNTSSLKKKKEKENIPLYVASILPVDIPVVYLLFINIY